MPNEDRWRAQMRALCEELGPDDGLSSEEIAKTERQRRRISTKHRRLAGQVKRAIELALGAAEDVALQGVLVVRCDPDPSGGPFRVVVRPHDVSEVDHVWARVLAAQGWLRAEVAQAVQRKNAPELRFVLDPTLGGTATRGGPR